MIHLGLNESFTNKTRAIIYYDVKYWNCVGYQQTERELLQPGQTVTKTQPSNKVTVYID